MLQAARTQTTHHAALPRAMGGARWALAIILLGHVALGLVYLFTTPAFETPDEPAHYRYVRYLAERRALPPLIVGDNEWDQGQMHQPPLYYALGALLVGHIAHDDAEAVFPRNPHVVLGRADVLGNKNVVLHREDASASAGALLLALRLMRGLSLSCAAATVALAYALGRRLAPGRPALAALGAALVAFNPQFLFIGTSVTNDPLVTLCTTLVLYLSIRAAEGEGGPITTPLALGIAVGAAGLAKLSGLASALLVVVAYGWRYHQRPGEGFWPGLARPLLLAGAAALAIAGWWYGRNAWLYRDPLGMRSYSELFAVHGDPLSLGEAMRVLYGAVISYWGVFGWMNVATPEAFYVFVRALCLVGVLGVVWCLARRAWRRDLRHPARPGPLLAGLWLLVVMALLLRWTQTITRTQGRLAFPAAAVIGVLLAHGLAAWLPRRFTPTLVWGLGGGLAAVALVIPFACIAPAYRPPATVTPETLPATARPVRVDYEGGMRLLAYEIVGDEVQPGGQLVARLYWETDAVPAHDYTVGVQILGRGGERIGGVDTYPAMGLRPTSEWTPGRVVVDEVAARVADHAAAPVAAALRISVYRTDPANPLPASAGDGAPLGTAPQIATVRVAARAPAAVEPQRPSGAIFDGGAELLGYDLTRVEDDSGSALELSLYWRCLQPLPEGYTVFVHLVDADGQTLAQADGQPMGGEFPMDYWRAGDVVQDARRLALPPVGGDALGVNLGFYHMEGGQRLPVTHGDGPAAHVHLDLGAVPPAGE